MDELDSNRRRAPFYSSFNRRAYFSAGTDGWDNGYFISSLDVWPIPIFWSRDVDVLQVHCDQARLQNLLLNPTVSLFENVKKLLQRQRSGECLRLFGREGAGASEEQHIEVILGWPCRRAHGVAYVWGYLESISDEPVSRAEEGREDVEIGGRMGRRNR